MKRFAFFGFVCLIFFLGCGEYKPVKSALESFPTPPSYKYQKAWEGSEKADQEFQEADKILKSGADADEFKKAYRLLMTAGKSGNLMAISAMASLNRGGYKSFLKKDLKKAYKYFKVAAKKGYPIAQHDLGMRYYKGEGVGKNLKEALRWYQASADQGFGMGFIQVAQCYEHGEGTKVDIKIAKQYYYWAAISNMPIAQYNLSILVGRDRENPSSKTDSHKWAIIAAANGYRNAVSLVSRQQSMLSKDERAYAEKSAKSWLEKNK